MEKLLSGLNLGVFRRFRGIDGLQLLTENASSYLSTFEHAKDINFDIQKFVKKPISIKQKLAGRLGCVLSFLFLFKEMALSGSSQPFIVFEDDVDTENNFSKSLNWKMEFVNDDWDVLMCGHCCTQAPKSGIWFQLKHFAGLHCFIVRNSTTAERLAEEFNMTELGIEADRTVSLLAVHDFFKMYGMVNQLAFQRRDLFKSDIPTSEILT